MTDKDTREAEAQMAGTARPHSERAGFMRARQINPEMEAFARSMVRQILQEQAQIKPEVSAPGSPGGPVAGEQPKPGVRSTELYTTAAAMLAIVGIVLGTIHYSAEIEGLSGEARAIVIGLVGAVATWAMQKLGVDYTGNRTALKLDHKR